jgi:membrane protease YdiL (CAAX protease family)
VPGWAPFLGFVFVLTLGVLLVARRSTALLRESPPSAPRLGEPSPPDPRLGPDPVRETPDRPTVRDLSTRALLANVAATQAIVAGLVLGGVVFFDIPQTALGLGPGPWVWGRDALALGVGLGLALWLASEAAGRLADAAGVAYDEQLRELLAPDDSVGWLALVLVVIPVIALSEELLFRAALIGVPAAALDVSPWVFVVLSSGLFALGHGAQGRVGIVATGVLGLALGGAFLLTESLTVVVLAHALVNALEFGLHEGLGLE